MWPNHADTCVLSYPLELADRTWDNVGLLLGNSHLPNSPGKHVVLVTNDLTPDVAEEAISKQASVIVTYRAGPPSNTTPALPRLLKPASDPFIFRGLKAITLDDPQQKTLIRLVQANVAVYSPHTAVDAAKGGLNDWLADMAAAAAAAEGISTHRSVVKPIATPGVGSEGVGYGRLVKFERPVEVRRLLHCLAAGLGPHHPGTARPRPFMVARPRGAARETVSSVAVCAGSGWSVLGDCDADVYFMGETAHHNANHAAMSGRWVITTFHSNSERYFLQTRLVEQLAGLLKKTVPDADVVASERDRDPFDVIMVDADDKELPDLSHLRT